jgi:hypothetical protein
MPDPWGWTPEGDPKRPEPKAPSEPGEGGTDEELLARGESGPRDGDPGQYEDD